MIHAFADVEIDPAAGEVRRNGKAVPVGARVLRLLDFLASNRDRIVTKDELVAVVWNGCAVSDNAIATIIKYARRAIGDDGRKQAAIRTQHGIGFRFVAPLRTTVPTRVERSTTPLRVSSCFSGKPSIAVLPFRIYGEPASHGHLAQAIPAEIITALSRLRWISVTARNSSFRFQTSNPDLLIVKRLLGVRYCLLGSIEWTGRSLAVMVELARSGDGVVIWSDLFDGPLDDIHEMRARIAAAVVAAMEIRVPDSEAEAARLYAPECLDAWADYHIGLQHLYRFNARDNETANAQFQQAIRKEPGFARAHAGLSFSWFQTAFMGDNGEDRRKSIERATAYAERSLELDALDPFASYCMGRSNWVAGDLEAAQAWMRRSTELCPNFAQGHYAFALMGALRGEGYSIGRNNETAMALSPLDPLRYAMLGTQCHIAINEADYDSAAAWSDEAAIYPGAHYLLGMLAAAANEMKGDHTRARHWCRKVQIGRPNSSVSRFFEAFPYAEIPERGQIEGALLSAGFVP